MPVMGTRAAASATGFGLFLGESAFISQIYNSANPAYDLRGDYCDIDSDGNTYRAVLRRTGSSTFDIATFLIKISNTGEIVYEKKIQNGDGAALNPGPITIGQDGYLYLALDANSSGTAVFKFALDGTIVSRTKFFVSSGLKATAIHTTASSKCYIFLQNGQIARLNASTFFMDGVWQLQKSGVQQFITFYCACSDGSSNVYIGSQSGTVFMIDSSFGISYYKEVVTNGANVYALLLSGSNLYVGSSYRISPSVYSPAVVKLNASNGNYISAFDVPYNVSYAGSGSNSVYGLASDVDGNFYVALNNGTINGVVKYSSSASVLWKRFTGGSYTAAIKISGSGMYLASYGSTSTSLGSTFAAKLTISGAKTGTYPSYPTTTYAYTVSTATNYSFTSSSVSKLADHAFVMVSYSQPGIAVDVTSTSYFANTRTKV